MTEKYGFKPFMQYAESSKENLEKLNSIRSLYYGYTDSGLSPEEFTGEFYRAVGEILMGKQLKHLKLEYIEFEWQDDNQLDMFDG